MNNKVFWKFAFIAGLIAWCIASVSPIQDVPFEEYISNQVTNNSEQFESLLKRANQRVEKERLLFYLLHSEIWGARNRLIMRNFFPKLI